MASSDGAEPSCGPSHGGDGAGDGASLVPGATSGSDDAWRAALAVLSQRDRYAPYPTSSRSFDTQPIGWSFLRIEGVEPTGGPVHA
jgi:hypothetical protein